MRAENIKAAASGGLKITAKPGSFTDSLRKGDTVRAQVISNDNGMLTLKTDKGQTFSASLGIAKNLAAGDKLLLDVTAKSGGMLTLSVREPEETYEGKNFSKTGENAESIRLVRDFNDRSLLPYAVKLSQMNLPVSEKTAAMMKNLIDANPNMTLEQAAFLAANKLADGGALQKAALDMLAENVKTDALIGKIIKLLEGTGFEKISEAGKDANQSAAEPPQAASTEKAGETGVKDSLQNAPLTKFFEQIGLQIGPNLKPVAGQVSHSAPIIPQSDTVLQSVNLTKFPEFFQNNSILQNISQNHDSKIAETARENSQFGSVNPQTLDASESLQKTLNNPEMLNLDARLASPAGVVAHVLSQIPQFKGTPPEILQKFSDMLLGVAAESAELTAKGGAENLSAMFEKLFTKIQTDDPTLGAKLAEAKNELFARLSIMQEAMAAADSSSKAELLDTTGRLINHVRLLNNIDQFMYMQLPVILAEEKKTVELYLFKRKGGRKPDPENVNILLSLDLENMGRCEAFLNIKGKDVSVKMKVAGKEQKDFLGENIVLLHNMLDQNGFKLTGTDISFSEENVTLLTAMLALENYTAGSARSIDFYL